MKLSSVWVAALPLCIACEPSPKPPSTPQPPATATPTARSVASAPAPSAQPGSSAAPASGLSPEQERLERWAQLTGRGAPTPYRDDDEKRYYDSCHGFTKGVLITAAASGGKPSMAALQSPEAMATMGESVQGMTPSDIEFCAAYLTKGVREYMAAARGGPNSDAPKVKQTYRVPERPVGLAGWRVGDTVEVRFGHHPAVVSDCGHDGELGGAACPFDAAGNPREADSELQVFELHARKQGYPRVVLASGLDAHVTLKPGDRQILLVQCQLELTATAKGAKIRMTKEMPWQEGYHPFVGRFKQCTATVADMTSRPPDND